MKKTVFATVNGQEITGYQIIRAKKRLLLENEEQSFVYKESDDNKGFLNTEALQKLIEIHALTALARFEGIEADEEEISKIIYELKTQYSDEFEWESNLHDLGLDVINLRDDIRNDILIDMLLYSRLTNVEEPNEENAKDFYQKNIQFMKHPSVYTFLEIEAPSKNELPKVAALLKLDDTSTIMTEASKDNLPCCLNEEIPKNKLPEELQSVLEDLEKDQIGSMPADDGSIVLIKLIKKNSEKDISEEEALPGLIEYLKIQQQSNMFDDLVIEALEKCEITYQNTELLKNL